MGSTREGRLAGRGLGSRAQAFTFAFAPCTAGQVPLTHTLTPAPTPSQLHVQLPYWLLSHLQAQERLQGRASPAVLPTKPNSLGTATHSDPSWVPSPRGWAQGNSYCKHRLWEGEWRLCHRL